MARRPLILSITAGAALTVACAGTKAPPDDSATLTTDPGPEVQPTSNPPAPEEPPPPPKGNPPPPPEVQLPTGNPPGPPIQPPTPRERLSLKLGYPSWDEVKSPHPEGATNPPSPVLIVTPEGDCYKTWEGGMIRPGDDRVEAVAGEGQGRTRIDCPPNAVGIFDAWQSSDK